MYSLAIQIEFPSTAAAPKSPQRVRGGLPTCDTGDTIPERQSSWMRVNNPAYTEIVGRETDLKGRKLQGNPIFRQESKMGKSRQLSQKYPRCLHENLRGLETERA